MRRILIAALLIAALPIAHAAAPAWAADVTEQSLMQAATNLAKQYDDNYNGKNAAGMAALYAPDGVLISPGPVVRGQAALKEYYASRFKLGITGHQTKVIEVHVQGDGGFGVGQFMIQAPLPGGGTREVHGNLATVYEHGADGWHLRLVAASVPPPPK
jgi:uncharacterized protein (TIGR02246 family)